MRISPIRPTSSGHVHVLVSFKDTRVSRFGPQSLHTHSIHTQSLRVLSIKLSGARPGVGVVNPDLSL